MSTFEIVMLAIGGLFLAAFFAVAVVGARHDLRNPKLRFPLPPPRDEKL